LREFLRALADDSGSRKYRTWFNKLLHAYLHYHYARPVRASAQVSDEASECARAQAVIRRACIKSAATGAGSGAITTGATMYLAESGPVGLLALPVAGLAIGSEMVYRAMLHIELACDLADIFGVAIDPEDPQALWHILTLALKEPEVPRGTTRTRPGWCATWRASRPTRRARASATSCSGRACCATWSRSSASSRRR